MLQKIGLALLAILTLGASVLYQRNKSLKRENQRLADERDRANFEARAARAREKATEQRLSEQEQINEKFDKVDIDPNDIKVGLDE